MMVVVGGGVRMVVVGVKGIADVLEEQVFFLVPIVQG